MRRSLAVGLTLVLLLGAGGCRRRPSRTAPPASRQGRARTSLHVAAGGDDVEIVRSLLTQDAEVNARDAGGNTPLHEAAWEASAATVRLLIEKGADVNARSNSGKTPLDHAFYSMDREDVVEVLIRSGAQAEARHLHSAAEDGYATVIGLLLAQGIDVDARSRDRSTPLHKAAGSGQRKAAELLIVGGADIHATDDEGRTPLHAAAAPGHMEMMNLLLDRGADVDARDATGGTPLLAVVQRGREQAVELLVTKGADINAWDDDGWTALHMAVATGRSDIVRLLIHRGASTGVKDTRGRTLLHEAVSSWPLQQGDAIDLLITGGAEVDAATPSGNTALHFAARDGYLRAAELLLAAGAAVNAQTAVGQTPLHLAVRRGHYDVVELLLDKKAKAALRDRNGYTPLDYARAKGNQDLAVLLMDSGARGNRQGRQGMAARDFEAVGPPRVRSEPRTDRERLVRGNSAFALDLYAQLRSSAGNLFFSPCSISMALAMAYAGARGNTEKEMAETLHFALDQERLHNAFARSLEDLNRIQEAGDITLCLANSLWPQEGYEFLADYLARIKTCYGAAITPLDFAKQRTLACQTINQWIAEQTRGKIRDVLHPGMLADPVFLQLVNAVYFKGRWKNEFDPARTRDQPFYLSAGKCVPVPMMGQKEDFRYAEVGSLQILELPYRGDELSMMILLPRRIEGLESVEQSLSLENLEGWRDRLELHTVVVCMPKFTIRAGLELRTPLQAMGMRDVFTYRKANFAGMDGHPDFLYVGGVIHEAFVEVNEEGTEAAAVTAVGMFGGAGAAPPVFRADHPFLFLIQENRSGSILFMGRVTDPTQTGAR